MSDMVMYPHIEILPGTNKPRIQGRRITVKFLALFLNDPEWPVERICNAYNLTPAEVHSAWAYYYDHQNEIDQALADDEVAYQRIANDPVQQANLKALKDKKQQKQ